MHRCLWTVALILVSASSSAGQTLSTVRADEQPQGITPNVSAVASVSRWVEPMAMTGGLMFQRLLDADGAPTLSQLRMHLQTTARIKLDAAGRASLVAGGGTGSSLRSGWNHTGVGAAPAVSTLYMKQLFVNVAPRRELQLQVGSMGGYRGHFSETVGFDNDVYLTGARLSVKAPARLWFNDVVVTRAYLGDGQTPSVFERLDRLSDSNYLQLAGSRTFGAASMSLEFVERDTTRSLAGAVQTRMVPGLTSLRLETAVNVAGASAHAVGAVAERVFGPVALAAGASSVDGVFGQFNGDRYSQGDRVFSIATWRPRPEITACVFVARAVRHVSEPRTRLDMLVTYDILRRLKGQR
jgi:hypothetical protein